MISLKNTLKAISSKFSALNTLLNDVPHYTLLWTNSGTTYSGGQITCDLSGYDAILLQVYYSSNQYTASHIYPFKDGNKILYSGYEGYYRSFTMHTYGLTYDTGSVPSWATTTYFVPYRIYGIKFGGGYKALRTLFAKEVAVC